MAQLNVNGIRMSINEAQASAIKAALESTPPGEPIIAVGDGGTPNYYVRIPGDAAVALVFDGPEPEYAIADSIA